VQDCTGIFNNQRAFIMGHDVGNDFITVSKDSEMHMHSSFARAQITIDHTIRTKEATEIHQRTHM